MGRLDILALLEESGGQCVSGEALARRLSVSRAAVWKSVRALQADGYHIESKAGCGYYLEESTDALLESSIREHLRTRRLGTQLCLYKTVDSTNTRLRAEAYSGSPEGTVIIADEQTAGKGRMGRDFYSPNRNGVYMSILLRPKLPFADIHFITMLAAVCVVEAVHTLTGLSTQIKWVNDILLEGRKLCGILSEAAVEGESGLLNFVVVGIGVNTGSTHDFPALQGNVAGALGEFAGKRLSRCALVAEILNNMERYYYPYLQTQDSAAFMQKYNQSLCLLGEAVTVTQGGQSYPAVVLGLSQKGGLLVRLGDGSTAELTSGEVSVRPINAPHENKGG